MKFYQLVYLGILVAQISINPAYAADKIPVVGAPGEPATIAANAAALTASAAKQQAETARFLAQASSELQRAQAAYQWERARHLRTMIYFLEEEYRTIQIQSAAFQREIQDWEWKASFLQALAVGYVDTYTMNILVAAMAKTGQAPEVLKEFSAPLGAMGPENFEPKRGIALTKPIEEFPGGNLWSLLRFARDRNLWLTSTYPAQVTVMTAVAYVSRAVTTQILRAEQAIQVARAARINEVFLHPPL